MSVRPWTDAEKRTKGHGYAIRTDRSYRIPKSQTQSNHKRTVVLDGFGNAMYVSFCVVFLTQTLFLFLQKCRTTQCGGCDNALWFCAWSATLLPLLQRELPFCRHFSHFAWAKRALLRSPSFLPPPPTLRLSACPLLATAGTRRTDSAFSKGRTRPTLLSLCHAYLGPLLLSLAFLSLSLFFALHFSFSHTQTHLHPQPQPFSFVAFHILKTQLSTKSTFLLPSFLPSFTQTPSPSPSSPSLSYILTMGCCGSKQSDHDQVQTHPHGGTLSPLLSDAHISTCISTTKCAKHSHGHDYKQTRNKKCLSSSTSQPN